MLILPKPTWWERISSQISLKRNSLHSIWPWKQAHQILKNTFQQTLLLHKSIGQVWQKLRTKVIVVHVGHSQLLVQLKQSSELNKALLQPQIFQSNNWLIVTPNQRAAMEVGKTRLSVGPQKMVWLLHLLIHTQVRIRHVKLKQEPISQSKLKQSLLQTSKNQLQTIQFQLLSMPQIGVPIKLVSSLTAKRVWIMQCWQLDITLTVFGSSRTHGEPLGERKDSSD